MVRTAQRGVLSRRSPQGHRRVPEALGHRRVSAEAGCSASFGKDVGTPVRLAAPSSRSAAAAAPVLFRFRVLACPRPAITAKRRSPPLRAPPPREPSCADAPCRQRPGSSPRQAGRRARPAGGRKGASQARDREQKQGVGKQARTSTSDWDSDWDWALGQGGLVRPRGTRGAPPTDGTRVPPWHCSVPDRVGRPCGHGGCRVAFRAFPPAIFVAA